MSKIFLYALIFFIPFGQPDIRVFGYNIHDILLFFALTSGLFLWLYKFSIRPTVFLILLAYSFFIALNILIYGASYGLWQFVTYSLILFFWSSLAKPEYLRISLYVLFWSGLLSGILLIMLNYDNISRWSYFVLGNRTDPNIIAFGFVFFSFSALYLNLNNLTKVLSVVFSIFIISQLVSRSGFFSLLILLFFFFYSSDINFKRKSYWVLLVALFVVLSYIFLGTNLNFQLIDRIISNPHFNTRLDILNLYISNFKDTKDVLIGIGIGSSNSHSLILNMIGNFGLIGVFSIVLIFLYSYNIRKVGDFLTLSPIFFSSLVFGLVYYSPKLFFFSLYFTFLFRIFYENKRYCFNDHHKKNFETIKL
jgi:hypothetical protein